MSAEPSNPSGLPGRNRPQLSDLSRETTEDDLWNLDEEPGSARPRQPKLSPPPSAPTKESKEPKEPVAPSEPATTLEPPMPRGLATPVKPLSPRTAKPDELGDLDESEPEAEILEEVPTLTSSIDEDPHEVMETPASPAPRAKSPAPPVEVPAPIEEPEPAEDESQDAAEDYRDDSDDEQVEHSAPRENRPRSAAAVEKASLPVARLNRREVIGIASFAVVIMIAAVWVISHFFSQLSFTRESDNRPSYPLKGELARVASANTFWREPVRSGENRDVARREVVLIPVLELSLDPEKSGGGALRVIFLNSEGQSLGDPITRSFGAGRFEATGSSTVTFAATDGFIADGDFQAYRTGKGKLWTAEVLEGPPGDSPASSFKKLSSIPILPDRR